VYGNAKTMYQRSRYEKETEKGRKREREKERERGCPAGVCACVRERD